jgi:CRISPR-associated endonuclease Csn1
MKTLGLDLGPNSIGWALVEDNADGSGQIIDIGVRVFPEGVDAFDSAKESSRNEQRRMARMMRRQLRRRVQRKRIVRQALIEAGLLPADPAACAEVLALDPYPLRAKGVNERLEPFEIGRVIYHLNQRRGFLSLKKVSAKTIEKELKAAEKKAAKQKQQAEQAENSGQVASAASKKDDESGMLVEIEQLKQSMGEQTLGQYLHDLVSNPPEATKSGVPIPQRIRRKHTRRDMLEGELLRLWEAQQKHHPALLTGAKLFGSVGRQDAMRTRRGMKRDRSKSLLEQFGLHGLMYYQRPIYWPREMIGMCELEKGKRRCHRAERPAQRFRMLQEINNLRYAPGGRLQAERALDADQRAAVLKEMYDRREVTFDQIRKTLGLLDSAKFNLERGERKKLQGCVTDAVIRSAWKDYDKLPEETKDRLVRVLIDAERDGPGAHEALMRDFGLSEEVADDLMGVPIPDGYVSYSLTAIEKLLPHLEKGMVLMGRTDAEESAYHAAGYLRRDELERRLFDELPSLEQIRSGPLSDLPNPVVRATMHELRRVVNAIVREHGKPDAVHIEMARSLQMSGEKRREYNKKNREREEIRDQARAFLESKKIAPTRDAVLKYRLWQEQKERCVYTGRSISFQQLFDGSTDIDHILPYSITLDDSQANKVVCFRDANREKGQRSPFEWLAGSDAKRFAQLESWTESLPWNKRRKFVQQEIKTDDFIQRQLVDSGYIARLAVVMMQMLVEKSHEVQGRKGTYTSDLRHEWGLHNLLSKLSDSPAWIEKDDLPAGEKNRADHRHHALDALVIALTNRKTLAAMHKAGRETVEHVDTETGEWVEYQRFAKEIPAPFGMEKQAFREMVLDRLRKINVSHRVRRGVRGGLHEETHLGPVYERLNGHEARAKRREGEFVVRKAVESLSPAEIEKIRDATIKKIVIERLKDKGIGFGRGVEKIPPKKMQEAMKDLRMPSGVPIRKVRIVKQELSVRPLREGKPGEQWVKPGSTHHLCIFEWTVQDKKGNEKRERDAVFVSMLEAKQRIKQQNAERERLIREGMNKRDAQKRAAITHPIIRRVHPEYPEAKFVMSLSGGELVQAKVKGREEPLLLVYKTAASTSKQMQFAMGTDARRSGDQPPLSFSPKTLDATKVTVDPLGRVYWARD